MATGILLNLNNNDELSAKRNQDIETNTISDIIEGCRNASIYYLKKENKNEFRDSLNKSQHLFMATCSISVKTVMATTDKYPCSDLRERNICLPEMHLTSHLLPLVAEEIEVLSKSKTLSDKYQLANLITDSVFSALPKAFPCVK